VRVRLYAVPCNFAGTSVYRQGFDPEMRGLRFWEHWSRVAKAANKFEETVSGDKSFLLLATEDLISSLKLPFQLQWDTTVDTEVSSEIEYLLRHTKVRYGTVVVRS
jgi:hypothetical protein